MSGLQFTTLDWIVLVVYFVGITAFGLWISRRTRSSKGYFLGDRQLPWWVMVGQSFGTGTHAENPVAQAGATCHWGFATIWYQWKNMLITPFYWLLGPYYRRSGRTTIGEIIGDRYGRGLALGYTLFALAFFVFCQGAMLAGAGKVIAAATGDAISARQVILCMPVAFVAYSLFGGLVASAYTDFVQGFLIIILSFMLIPLGLAQVGGFAGMRAALPASFFDLYNQASGVDAFTIAMLTLNGLVGITAQPHMISLFATGRSERGGRVGMTYGSFVKRFCTIGWAMTGLIVAALLVHRGESLADPEQAFGYASLHLLGSGLVGLLVACVLAANMSACSNFMVNTGALFTRNLYHDFFRPQAPDPELLWVGRLSGLLLTALGVTFALYVRQILDAFMFTETIAALIGISFMGGFLWKRANRWGAWGGTLAAFAAYYGLNFLLTCGPEQSKPLGVWDALCRLSAAWGDGRVGDLLAGGQWMLVYRWSAGGFGCAMLAGGLAFLVVSLLTRPEDPRRIAAFFDNMCRSGDGDGPAAARGEEMILLDLPGWLTAARWRGFWGRYREDLGGFALGWLAVAVMVGVAWGVMQLGR